LHSKLCKYVSGPEIFFRERAIEYCKYRSTNFGSEFPFALSQQVFGGGEFFPTNLVLNTGSIDIVGPGVDLYPTAVSSLVDNDFCCERLISEQQQCGIQFSPARKRQTVNRITLGVRDPGAYVNSIVVTFFNSCNHMPQFFNVKSNQFGTLQDIGTDGPIDTTTCTGYPGETGLPVAFCAIYFPPVVATQFAIEWEADTPVDGAWIYEFAVQGIVLDAPYSLVFPSFVNPSFPSDNVTLGPFNFNMVTVANNSNIFWVPDFPKGINVNLEKQNQNSLIFEDVTNLLDTNIPLSQYFGDDAGPFATIFDGIRFKVSPNPGKYRLVFYSPVNTLKPSYAPFTIRPGSPTSMSATFGTYPQPIRTRSRLTLDPINICVRDITGSILDSPVDVDMRSISGTALVVEFPRGRSVIGCQDVSPVIVNGLIGLYTVEFLIRNSQIIAPQKLSFTITAGDPASLYAPPTQYIYDNIRFLITPLVRVIDEAGNTIADNRVENATVRIESFSPNNIADLSGDSAVVNNGIAKFQSLSFSGVRNTIYSVTLRLRSAVTQDPLLDPYIIRIFVSDCAEENYLVRGADGRSCLCAPGYYPSNDSCVACSPSFYKPTGSNSSCLECQGDQTTNFAGALECVCISEKYLKNNTCVDCPAGAICRDNFIVGNEEGFWQSSEDPEVFYPCYKNDPPSARELRAAAEACPRLAVNNNGSQTCAVGYTGIRCLVCAKGYGTSGPFCSACPKQSLNWVIVVACGLIALALLVFLVYQGRTPKNKESVSTKILLNHIQMLALLSALGSLWTQPFNQVLYIGGIASFIDNNFVSADCAFDVSYAFEFGFFMLIPIFTLLICGVIFFFIYLVRLFLVPKCTGKSVSSSELRNAVLAGYVLAVIVINFIVYPAICIKVMEIFDCSIVVGDKKYLNTAPEIECGTSQHTPYFIWGIVMLIVFCVGVPIFAAVMLVKYKKSSSPNVQMVLRFLYDGFKGNRFYWEIVIMLRKFLIVVAITIAPTLLYQVYGMTFIVQAALLLHLLLHPYTSGRQFRLELWSLVAMIMTLFTNLYVIEEQNSVAVSLGLSILVLVIHIAVVIGFIFFIGRGLMRRFLSKTWAAIRGWWSRIAPKKLDKSAPKFQKAMNFMERFAASSDFDKQQVFTNLQKWWKQAPIYKRKRLLSVLSQISEGTPYESQLKAKKREKEDDSIELGVLKM